MKRGLLDPSPVRPFHPRRVGCAVGHAQMTVHDAHQRAALLGHHGIHTHSVKYTKRASFILIAIKPVIYNKQKSFGCQPSCVRGGWGKPVSANPSTRQCPRAHRGRYPSSCEGGRDSGFVLVETLVQNADRRRTPKKTPETRNRKKHPRLGFRSW